MILQVSDLSFAYNSRQVLSDIRFTLREGEVLGVLGVNGAGKSTLLKCLNRVLSPRQGAVLLDGEDLLRMSPGAVARRVGYVPQRHQETRFTVYEAILLGRKPHMGWTLRPADYAVVETVICRMGLEEMALRPVSELSGGEAQKVMIARALAQSPRVLLLDEPTSSLDLKNQLEVMTLIRRIVNDQHLSAVVSIHDLNLAVRFADAFLFLRDHTVYDVVPRHGLQAETIRAVYGVDVALREVDGHTVVVPL